MYPSSSPITRPNRRVLGIMPHLCAKNPHVAQYYCYSKPRPVDKCIDSMRAYMLVYTQGDSRQAQ